ncbi:hypothetical protein COT62_00850 [Candidatus Roizmanbacteria bacterium CG09_land_8_20_14_0_10_41_9]|uniref:Phosphatidic acid phosphatase type 2/haloperoxidase domain-containing protein n=1 Tax=Candidatus Roizmanbacteria bacterium CG09_land_8_20_14_0_10_41_9 TaxID=1974850 RepID=A0A2H0WTK8_9BACT|nr:MAG: hypothetical protein COT62_00850 [Candidatus Roizmanbacteria bacterium CG09_land_8_20_14_0_10_41_9]
MVSFIQKVDSGITQPLCFLFPHTGFFDLFFSFFSLKGDSFLIWVLILFFLVLFEKRRDKRFILYFFASFAITALVSNFFLKNIFQRVRPYTLLEKSIAVCPTDFSFPSGHAATAVAAATILSAFDKKRKWFYYTVALLISFSRIYLGCHYVVDIVGGALVGWLISKGVLFLVKRIT